MEVDMARRKVEPATVTAKDQSTENPNKVGNIIKEYRLKNSLTQTELAHKIDVTQGRIAQWEGGRDIPDDQLRKLKAVLGFSETVKGSTDKNESTMPETSSIGAWLAKQRNEKNMTVSELSAKSGVPIPTIYAIEYGRSQYPRSETLKRLRSAFTLQKGDIEVITAIEKEIKEEAEVKGLGTLTSFDPYDDNDLPNVPGVYVFYDISDRPIYVGKSDNSIRTRVRDHQDKFWFKWPIVKSAMYIEIHNEDLTDGIETLLIRFLKNNAVINKQKADRD